jgi:two-component system chemotaxis sensor kinase CheA
MELRVVPIGTLFARLPRVVRSVAQAAGKDVDLALEGHEVSIDRSIVELLADPLLHLVRNAVDHGVEPPDARRAAGKPARATLRVRARRSGGQVRVEVSDDGRGIDRAAVLRAALARGLVTEEEAAATDVPAVHALLFRAGFSTSKRVSETSGRGVGLDVVQDAVRRAGGAVEVSSAPGRGTAFALTMPLSAAMVPVLLVEVAGHPYALPIARVEAVVDGPAAPAARTAAGVVPLARLLGLPAEEADGGGVVVLRQSGGRRVGLAVGRVQRRTDLLLRPLHPALAALPAVGGVGVLGNGEPVVVLEPDGIPLA